MSSTDENKGLALTERVSDFVLNEHCLDALLRSVSHAAARFFSDANALAGCQMVRIERLGPSQMVCSPDASP